jgi:hypothetical protein
VLVEDFGLSRMGRPLYFDPEAKGEPLVLFFVAGTSYAAEERHAHAVSDISF